MVLFFATSGLDSTSPIDGLYYTARMLAYKTTILPGTRARPANSPQTILLRRHSRRRFIGAHATCKPAARMLDRVASPPRHSNKLLMYDGASVTRCLSRSICPAARHMATFATDAPQQFTSPDEPR